MTTDSEFDSWTKTIETVGISKMIECRSISQTFSDLVDTIIRGMIANDEIPLSSHTGLSPQAAKWIGNLEDKAFYTGLIKRHASGKGDIVMDAGDHTLHAKRRGPIEGPEDEDGDRDEETWYTITLSKKK